ncbi:MAG: FMN-binding protein [Spirochaetes bacterium]|jgi:uncharacterized protein with FMN-binding domain|nr:FMN-binding protein [Spirochaetota bacterium]
MKNFRGLLSIAFILVFFSCSSYEEIKRAREMPIKKINPAVKPDGKYRGAFTYGGFTYEVEVVLKGGVIRDILVLKNRDTEYARLAEGVTGRIRKSNSLDVDAVTGATTTSKALMKAVENALDAGPANR